MKCGRCGSVMVHERFYGLYERFLGWRCIFCGEIVDEVILENRGRVEANDQDGEDEGNIP